MTGGVTVRVVDGRPGDELQVDFGKFGGPLLVAAALPLAAYGDDSAGPEAGADVEDVEDVANDDQLGLGPFLGNTVSGEVTSIISPMGFRIGGDDWGGGRCRHSGGPVRRSWQWLHDAPFGDGSVGGVTMRSSSPPAEQQLAPSGLAKNRHAWGSGAA